MATSVLGTLEDGTCAAGSDSFHHGAKNCKVHLTENRIWDVDAFLEAFSLSTCLTTLSVDFVMRQEYSRGPGYDETFCIFKALKHLNIRISGATKGIYNQFISSMHAPELETLSIDFTAGGILSPGGDGLGDVALSFSDCDADFRKLKYFALRLTGSFEFQEFDTMGEFFRCMPNLEELQLYGAGPTVLHPQFSDKANQEYPWNLYPSLRRITIHLERVDNLILRRMTRPPFFTKLIKVLKSRPSWRNFESFDLGECTESERPVVNALGTALRGKQFRALWIPKDDTA